MCQGTFEGRTHVDGELPEIRVELTGESEAGRDAGHDDRDEVVEVSVRGRAELEGLEADLVYVAGARQSIIDEWDCLEHTQCLVVNAEGLVGVLDELMDGERGVVRLDDGVRDLKIRSSVFAFRKRIRRIFTFGDGTTLKEHIMRSGYSSRILEIKSVPIPAPVPPPREWVIWKPSRSTDVSRLLRDSTESVAPCRQSQPSASFLTTSSTESTSSAPSV